VTDIDSRPSATIWMIGLLMLLTAGKAIGVDNLDPDFFWHLRVAGQLSEQGVRPLVDSMSFNAITEPWVPYSWLAQRFMLWVWESWGVSGVLVIDAFCSALFVLLLALACRSVAPGNPFAWVAGAAAATLFSLSYTSFRPATFALTLLACVVWLVLRDRANRSQLVWLCPPLFVLLANVHLYALVGVALLWAYAAGCLIDRRPGSRRVMVLALACGLGSLMTPLLPGVIEQMHRYRAQDVMVASGLISEMRPFYASTGGLLLTAVVVAVVGSALGARRTCWAMLLPLGLATCLLMQWGRFAPIWALVAVPTMASLIPTVRLGLIERKPTRIALASLCGLVLLGVLTAVPAPTTSTDDFVQRFEGGLVYPVAAARFVEGHVEPASGRLINEFTWGGYLAWRLGDRYQVFVDGRTQLYDADFWHETYVGREKPSPQVFERARADVAIIPAERSRFDTTLREMGWVEVYRDAVAVVLTPPPAATATAE
jgi:hypothetical protein